MPPVALKPECMIRDVYLEHHEPEGLETEFIDAICEPKTELIIHNVSNETSHSEACPKATVVLEGRSADSTAPEVQIKENEQDHPGVADNENGVDRAAVVVFVRIVDVSEYLNCNRQHAPTQPDDYCFSETLGTTTGHRKQHGDPFDHKMIDSPCDRCHDLGIKVIRFCGIAAPVLELTPILKDT